MTIKNGIGFIKVHVLWSGNQKEFERGYRREFEDLEPGVYIDKDKGVNVRCRNISIDAIASSGAIFEVAGYKFQIDPPSPFPHPAKQYGFIKQKSGEILVTRETHVQIENQINKNAK